MSEETAPAPQTAIPPAKKPGGPPIVLIAAIAGGLLAGAAVGVFVVGPMVAKPKIASASAAHGGKDDGSGKDAHGKEKKGGHGEKSAIYRIENLIVNPAGSNGQRFLMASVALEFKDPKAEEAVRSHEVELRDEVISTLESQSLEELTRLGARDSLRDRLVVRLQPIVGKGVEYRVFLPQYVIQ